MVRSVFMMDLMSAGMSGRELEFRRLSQLDSDNSMMDFPGSVANGVDCAWPRCVWFRSMSMRSISTGSVVDWMLSSGPNVIRVRECLGLENRCRT